MSTIEQNASCENRIDERLKNRLSDLQKLWTAWRAGDENGAGDLGTLPHYGLAFEYIAAGSFYGQRDGYFRYQLSWDGPRDEFRFFANSNLSCFRVEYWFLDWSDGASRTLEGKPLDLLLQLWGWIEDIGAVRDALKKARASL